MDRKIENEIKNTVKEAVKETIKESLSDVKKTKRESGMRNAAVRVSALNTAHKDYPELGYKKGDVIRFTLEDIVNELKNWAKRKKLSYFVACHDKGKPTEHFHCVLCFDKNSQATRAQIKAHFMFGDIEPCKRRFGGVKGAVQYLVHLNHPSKEQIEWESVITNKPSQLELYKNKEERSIDRWFAYYRDKILAGEIREYQLELIDPEVYIARRCQFEALFDYVKKVNATRTERDISIIVVQGPPGFGKDAFVEDWAKRNGKSLCKSSASNDAWQDYKGQDCMVFTDNDFSKINVQDAKKTFDPYHQSTVKARYKNKLFIGDTIFVCTNTPFLKWFPNADSVDRDAIFRRITTVLDFVETDGKTSIYTVNDLLQTGSGWELKTIETRKFEMGEIIDLQAAEKKKQRFLDSLG